MEMGFVIWRSRNVFCEPADVSISKTEHPNAINVQTTPPPEPSTSQHTTNREEKTEYAEGLKVED